MTNYEEQITEIMKAFDCSRKLAERVQKLVMNTIGYTGGIKSYQYENFQKWDKANLSSLRVLDILLDTYGVEYIREGKNENSPSFYYLNQGETYTPTLCYFPMADQFPFIISSWGDIVENGDYE